MHFRVLQQKHFDKKKNLHFSVIIARASQGGSAEQQKHVCQPFAGYAECHQSAHLACCDVSKKGKISVMSAMHTMLQVTQHRKAPSSS